MATASSSSSSSPVLYAAHRRRLNDVDSDGGHRGHGAGAVGVKALFSVRRNNKRASVVDHAWMRNAVTCLLCLAVVVGLLSSHRGGSAGGRLVQKVDVGDGEVLGWREENLTTVARRPPDPPGSNSEETDHVDGTRTALISLAGLQGGKVLHSIGGHGNHNKALETK